MRKKFVKFNNHSEYLDYIESTALTRPNVALCAFEDENHFYPKWHNPPQDYVLFKDPVVWKECCLRWGDFYEENITAVTTPIEGGSTIERTSVKKIISMLNTTRVIEHTIGTFVTTEESTETAETTTTETSVVKTPIGITVKQMGAVTTFGTDFLRNAVFTSFPEIYYFTGVTSINTNIMQDATFEKVVIPGWITSITALRAFSYGYGKYIEFEEGFTTAASQTFWDAPRTENIVIFPSTTTTFKSAFGYRAGSSVIMKAVTPPDTSGAARPTSFYAIVYVPDESYEAYLEAWTNVPSGQIKPKSELPDELKQYWP